MKSTRMIKSGITEWCFSSQRGTKVTVRKQRPQLTVDGDSNTLVESVSISTNKGWNLSKLVQLEVLSGETLCWLSLDNLEVNIVGLCDCANGS